MKQLFSYYDDGEQHVYEGDAFVTRSIDSEKSARIREIEKKLDKSLDDYLEKMPIMTPIHYLLLACALVIIGIMIYATSSYGSIDDAFSQNPLLIVILGIACLGTTVIAVIEKKNRNTQTPPQNTDDALIEEQDTLLNEAFDTLGIPSDEIGFDVITPKDTDNLDTLSEVETLYLTVFTENDTVILTDCHKRYEFKKSDFKTVEHVKRPLFLLDAVNPIFKEICREYNVKEKDGGYLIGAYDLFTLETEHGDYTLALPDYDGEKLAEILGMKT